MIVSARLATLGDLESLAPLFDSYRQFYGKPPDLELARRFLSDRLSNQDSLVLVAEDAGRSAVGFMQLYPSFSSVRAARIYVLNDLFVAPSARRHGAGALLLRTAADVARAAGGVRLKLSTAITNLPAQRLYTALGWKRDDEFYEYGLSL
jgi:ribosomal protein S18 acetylase RimI-like enzyme